MTKGRRVLLGAGIVVAVLALGALAVIGPRNVLGMLRYDIRSEGTLKPGDPAPDVELLALDGTSPVALRSRIGARPLVLVFGSFT